MTTDYNKTDGPLPTTRKQTGHNLQKTQSPLSLSVYLSCGLSYLWFNQNKIDTKQSKQILHNRIEDIVLQNWYTDVITSSMCTIYRRFKKKLDFETI